MGRILTSADEVVVRAFRPHPVAWLPVHAAALAWLVWGGAASLVRIVLPGAWGLWLATAVFVLLVAGHGWLRHRFRRRPQLLVVHGAAGLIAVAAAVAETQGLLLPTGETAAFNGLALGAAFGVLSLLLREATRWRSATVLTNQRLLLRRGLVPRQETVLPLRDVEAVERSQGLMGGLLGYGRLRLVKARRRRTARTTKKGSVETEEDDVVEVRGVPRFAKTVRTLDDLVAEARMTEQERQRRIEERRLKESLDTLARWEPRRRHTRV